MMILNILVCVYLKKTMSSLIDPRHTWKLIKAIQEAFCSLELTDINWEYYPKGTRVALVDFYIKNSKTDDPPRLYTNDESLGWELPYDYLAKATIVLQWCLVEWTRTLKKDLAQYIDFSDYMSNRDLLKQKKAEMEMKKKAAEEAEDLETQRARNLAKIMKHRESSNGQCLECKIYLTFKEKKRRGKMCSKCRVIPKHGVKIVCEVHMVLPPSLARCVFSYSWDPDTSEKLMQLMAERVV